jgi:FkbM family methyltransferase
MALHRLLGLERRHLVVSTVLHHPVRFRVNLDLFCLHERMAFFMDHYEPGTVEFLLRLRQPGETFLDVGANIGLIAVPFTLLCAAKDREQRRESPHQALTYCIEAVAANRESLAANIALNGLADQIAVVGSAVGEREKDVDLQVELNQKSGEGTGTANILPEGSAYECERIALHVTTIDRLVDAGALPRRCGLMKIDTDGYDLFALMGARRFIEEARPVIYGEFMAHCLGWHGQTIGDVQAFLGPLGYKVYTRRQGWSFKALGDGAPFVQDALCVPDEKLERVRWCIC